MKSTIFILALMILVQFTTSAKNFNIVDFGAKGDGKTVNTFAIQSAIDACHKSGGGTVEVPAGIFFTGTINLKSNVNLFLQPGSLIKGTVNLKDYNYQNRRVGLIYTEKAENVSISGFGTIDGNGDAFMKLDEFKVISREGKQFSRQKDQFRVIPGVLSDGPLVPLERPFQMIIFSNCKNVTIRDVTVSNSPFWTIHLADVNGGVISGVKINNSLLIPNNDGIDLTSCSNINVSDCNISGGDDGFAITGYAHHFDLPGYKNLVHDSENINVSNCNIVSRSSGIRIGGWDQNHMRNYNFSNINISNSNRGIVLTVRDSGMIENMNFNNIVIETRLHTGDWWGNGEPIQIAVLRGTPDVKLGVIRNIFFSNIIARSEAGIVVFSSEESEIVNLQFRDVYLKIMNSPYNNYSGGNFDLRPVSDPRYSLFAHDIPGLFAKGVRQLSIRNFRLEWDGQKQDFFTRGIEVEDFDGLEITDFHGASAPASQKLPAVKLSNGKNWTTNISPEKIEKIAIFATPN
ncbi:MAG: glycosyl hydrolase family 28 protein [Bacteroidota bacterium]|nr:glycosyl hydrolase family 28 protein [Bacteroidota bacterium]